MLERGTLPTTPNREAVTKSSQSIAKIVAKTSEQEMLSMDHECEATDRDQGDTGTVGWPRKLNTGELRRQLWWIVVNTRKKTETHRCRKQTLRNNLVK